MQNHLLALNWMQETLDAFVNHLSLSKSVPTVEAYRYDVAKFLEYLYDKKVRRISSIKAQSVTNYLGWAKSFGRSDASLNRYYMSIKAYNRFLRKARYLQFDFMEDVPIPRNKVKAPRIISIDEIELLLKQPDINTEPGMRDRCILELLYSSGLRASELCDLMIEDIVGQSVHIRSGKGSKTRTIPITQQARWWIGQYVIQHRGTERGSLFLTLQGKRVSSRLLYDIVKQHACKADLQDVTPHTLRHACATHLMDQGADIRMIQGVLGHSSIASTQRYTHLSSFKMQEMFQQFHPRKKEEHDSHDSNADLISICSNGTSDMALTTCNNRIT